MARFGNWAPLAANWASQPRMAQVDIISIHTMVGSLSVVDAMFRRNGFGGTFSHFGIGGDGTCTQWQDTAYRAAANYNGNWHIVSVECADVGPPFAAWNTNDGNAVPAFSDAQLRTLANLIATIAPAHNIPIVLIPDAKPGRRGIGYHRQGVPGYMVAGAEQWSTAQGKVCPGNRRIAQIPQIIAAANGANPGSSIVLDTETATQISKIVVNALTTPGVGALDWKGTKNGPQSVVGQMRLDAEGLGAIYTMVAGQNAAIEKLAEAIASGRDDLTADELRQAVSGAIQDAGAALRATQATAGPAQ